MRRDRRIDSRARPPWGRVRTDWKTAALIERLEDRSLLSISVNSPDVIDVSTGTTNAPFVVSLSAPLTHTVTVDYYTADGTANQVSDYKSTTGTVTFNPGETGKLVMVPVNGTTLYEADKTFTLNLLNPIGDTILNGQGTATILNQNLPPQVTIDDFSQIEPAAGTVNAVTTIHLSTASGVPATVTYSTSDISGHAGTDYQATTGTATFAPGQTAQTIAIPINGSKVSTGNRTFAVNINSVTGATIQRAQAIGTIVDDNPPVGLSVQDAGVSQGSTGDSTALFTVQLAAASGQVVSVNFATADGTALAGTDYLATSGSLTFNPGQTTQAIPVTVLPSSVPEPNEQFTLNLTSPVNTTISRGTATGTITNVVPGPDLSIGNASIVKGSSGTSNAVFDVTLSAPSNLPVSVNYNTSDITAIAGSDYQSTSGSLTFPAGATVETIPVPVIGNTTPEGNKLFAVNLSGAKNALISNAQAQGTIVDNTILPMLTIDDVSQVAGTSGTTDAVFHVTLSTASAQTVAVNFATSNITALAGVNYQPVNGSLTFSPGQTVETISVPVIGTTLSEPTKTYAIDLSGATNASVAIGRGVGTILNNNALPTITIADITTDEEDAGTTNAVFTVSLSAASGNPVTVSYATADLTGHAGVDYQAVSGQITFAPGQTSAPIAVPIIGNPLHQPQRTFSLNLSNPGNAIFGTMQAIGTIIDNTPLPALSVSNVVVTAPVLGTAPASFIVSLSAPSTQAVTVSYATADGSAIAFSNYTPVSGTATFAPGETTQTVIVPVLAQTVYEPTETFSLVLSSPQNATIAAGQGTATIRNNVPQPGLVINDVQANEGDFTTTSATFTVALTGPAGVPVTANYATADGTAAANVNYTPVSGTLTFAPGQTVQTITVPVLDDLVVTGNETFSVILSNPSNATLVRPQGTATIIEGDSLVVSNTADSGPGSLRAAITRADLTSGPNGITFDIPGPSPYVINVRSPLPTITNPMLIDGTTQPGYAGAPLVELNGGGAGTGVNGLVITGGNSTVRGLAIDGFNGSGIFLEGRGGNTIQANYLGVLPDGNTALGNAIYGVLIYNSPANLIGGTSPAARNVISGNGLGGVYLGFGDSTGNIVEGDLIGTNASGTLAVPNGLNGIFVDNAPANQVGGRGTSARNIISGNAANGVVLFGAGAVRNRVQGNQIGVSLSGAFAIPNRGSGILSSQVGRAGNVIGGRFPGVRNVIVNNANGGVRVQKVHGKRRG